MQFYIEYGNSLLGMCEFLSLTVKNEEWFVVVVVFGFFNFFLGGRTYIRLSVEE